MWFWHCATFPGDTSPSIIAAVTFNYRVRDGSEWFHYAINTKTLNSQNCKGKA